MKKCAVWHVGYWPFGETDIIFSLGCAFAQALALKATIGNFRFVRRALQTTKLLSGGEKQRVAIARALCNQPDILFADEPSGNLDRQTSRTIHDLLLNYVKEEGKTLVVVTHDLELAARCDRRFSLENGILS